MKSKKKNFPTPILSLEFYLEGYHQLVDKLKLDHDVAQLSKHLKCQLDSATLEILETSNYEALVMTDLNKEIVWANNGFREMTGYSTTFARGKKPSFLQGKDTMEDDRQFIRARLSTEKRFKASITNYKKNGDKYLCQIDVIPLFNTNDQLTHFLAMESELKVA